MAPRLSGQNCKFFMFPLSLNSQKRLRYKENNTKYRGLTWKPRSHVRILIYWMWPIDKDVKKLWECMKSFTLPYSNCAEFPQNQSNHFKIQLPHPIMLQTGHVRYINILTWLRGFQVKPPYLVLSSLYLSLFWELRDKGNLKNLQFWPESLGAMLEYWYIERGLLFSLACWSSHKL